MNEDRERQSPLALTEAHLPALERAIRAEGFKILVEVSTGEVKLVPSYCENCCHDPCQCEGVGEPG